MSEGLKEHNKWDAQFKLVPRTAGFAVHVVSTPGFTPCPRIIFANEEPQTANPAVCAT